MATYLQIHERATNLPIQGQVSVAIATEAKYKLQNSQDAGELAWATWVIPRSFLEAKNWQTVICTDPIIADAVDVRDEDIQAAVTALVPTMVQSYLSQNPPAAA
jgi:hypothetical protein